jgi:hypothetical protein
MLIEREIACDETAVRLTGCPKRYAACLTAIATLPAAPLEPIEAVGVLSTPALTRRVVRILSRRRVASPAVSAGAAAVAVLVLSAFSVTAASHRLVRVIGSEPLMKASSMPGSGNPVAAGEVAEAAREVRARQRNVGSSMPESPQNDRGSTPKSLASQETGARGAKATDTLPPAAAESPAAQAPAPIATAGGLTPPRLVPLAAPAPSLPVIDKPALAAPPLTPESQSTSPWGAVADAGVSVGHGSQQAGVATGRFFSRLGKKIAGSF